MLKRVGETRHPCGTTTVVQNKSSMLLLKRTVLVALSQRCLMTQKRVGTDVVLLHGCQKAACKTLLKASFKSTKTW